jgi:hypothetical protein
MLGLASPALLKAGLALGGVALLGFLLWIYGHGKYLEGRNEERGKWGQAQAKADKEILRLNVALVTSQLTASQNYAEKLDAREPIIVHDRTTVEKFAATAAGAAICLPADRVRDIEATAAQRGLGDPTASKAGAVPVHADTVSKVP